MKRVRADAALDLIRRSSYAPLLASPSERAALRTAIIAHPSPQLLRLAARLPGPDLLSGILAAGLVTRDDETLEAVGAALRLQKPTLVLSILGAALRGQEGDRAASAARLLGWLLSDPAASLLASALDDPRTTVQRAVFRGLATGEERLPPAVSAALARRASESGPLARRALAILASRGAGKELARLAKTHADPKIRALTEELRRNPIQAPRRLLD